MFLSVPLLKALVGFQFVYPFLYKMEEHHGF